MCHEVRVSERVLVNTSMADRAKNLLSERRFLVGREVKQFDICYVIQFTVFFLLNWFEKSTLAA